MYINNNLATCLVYLHQLYSPSEYILIGTNIQEWITYATDFNILKVHYIDADKRQIKQINSQYNLPKNWFLHQALVHHSTDKISLYSLSNPAFNGTVSHELLSTFWKNIHTTTSQQFTSTTLDSLLSPFATKNSKWLIIDCFQSLNILKGTNTLLNTIEVIIARTTNNTDSKLDTINQETLNIWMTEKGYKNIGFFEENHPQIGMSLFVKDYKAIAHKQQTLLRPNNEKDLDTITQNNNKWGEEKRILLNKLEQVQQRQDNLLDDAKLSQNKISNLSLERDKLLKQIQQLKVAQKHDGIRIDNELKKIETQIQFMKKFSNAK